MGEQALQQPRQEKRGLLIAGLLIAMLFAALDGTIVSTAMPRIVGELGGLSMMAWLTTSYMLTSTAVVPIAGKLADLLGRKVVYVAGIAIFIIGSALCGMAQDMMQLIIFRGIQGIGGGIMMPMAMIIIGDIFTGKERAKWQGVFGGIYGLASVIGPQVGGWIVDTLDWRWVFYINLPVGILAAVVISMGLQGHTKKDHVKFDIAGMFTMIVGVVSLLLALTFGGVDYPWGSWQIISLFALAAIFLVAFVVVETKTEEPILPMHLFKNKAFVTINAVGFLMSIGMFGAIMFVPLFMQGVVGVSATESGTIMTPMMISLVIASIIGGRIVVRIGVKPQIIVGLVTVATAFYLLSTMDINTTKMTTTTYMIVLGLGLGLVMPTLTLALQEVFSKKELGVVTSSSQFFRQIGGTLGMTVLGAVMNARSTNLLTDKLVPFLNTMPKEMNTQMSEMIHTNPQGLYSMLLNPDLLSTMPPSVIEHVVPIVKDAMVGSIHSVFLVGLCVVAIAAVIAVFLRNIRLSDRKKDEVEKEESVVS
ncbi:MDR family MFS transporter [Priestia taiwanensis]|uniref:MFS transporter n=1 Tax=Priestia taiwanensis TaxID=1347902 RepID=A0A917ENN9_9BACI|nr:MDR family MFS transporter [Priestia taiwanensis]MBM7363106.1 EmrB/QacA subfamily drug resistance transporter [Priestia taiwanensis]GGE67736.1 MFS transporter [Priestia taiwanensis]